MAKGPSFSQAADWFEKAALQGNAEAMRSLGFLLEMKYLLEDTHGDGGGTLNSLDYMQGYFDKTAALWYRHAADKGLAQVVGRSIRKHFLILLRLASPLE